MSLALEDRLLLACARTRLRPEDARRAADALTGNPDWKYLVEASVRHAVAPLLHHGLTQLAVDNPEAAAAVPPHVRRELEELYLGNRERSRRLFSILGDIVTSFTAAGVDVLGLKDAQLAVEVYPERALRPMGDIDLLIRRDAWGDATECLRKLGFEPQPNEYRPFTEKYAAGQQFRRASDETWLDLQWHVAELEWDRFGSGRFTFDTDRLWRGAVPLRIDDYELLAPSPVDMLIHLCLHLEGHKYSELVLFCDIVAFLDHYEHSLDWDTLVRVARDSGGASSVYHVLLLTGLLFEISMPAGVLDQLRPAYFRGNLAEPVFDNLGSLHAALDDIATAVSPPPSRIEELERMVRRQATYAMGLESELDDLATEFVGSGGGVLVFLGEGSPAHFPDAAGPAFGSVDAFVLEDDAAAMERALELRGFRGDHPGSMLVKAVDVPTKDPMVRDTDPPLTIGVTFVRHLPRAFMASAPSYSPNKDAALRSLRRQIRRGPDTVVRASLTIRPLSPAEMLVALTARLGRQEDGQLFTLCSLHDLLRRHPKIEGDDATRIAQDNGVANDVAIGLAIVAGVFGEESLPVAVRRALPWEATPKILTWARYGPSSLKRHPELRDAFLYVHCLLGGRGVGERAGFVGRSLRAQGEQPAVLLRLASQVLVGAVRQVRRGELEPGELAYWVEKAPVVPVT